MDHIRNLVAMVGICLVAAAAGGALFDLAHPRELKAMLFLGAFLAVVGGIERRKKP